VKSLRASGLLLAPVIGLMWVTATAFAQEASTDPTTTDQTTTAETTTNDGTTPVADPWAVTPRTRYLHSRAMRFKRIARRFTKLMHRERQRVGRSRSEFDTLLGYRLWLRKAWRLRAERSRYRAHHPPHLAGWRCIHRYEGSWSDPNSPYYGGLQMDLGFQRTYGPGLLRRKGTADHWAPFEQMWIAERAFKAGLGFSPWPLTSRRCGLS
jgi:hypothetical protein